VNCKCGLPMVKIRFRAERDRTVYTSYQCACGQRARQSEESVYWLKPGEKGRPRS
jgi:hypothetical protein